MRPSKLHFLPALCILTLAACGGDTISSLGKSPGETRLLTQVTVVNKVATFTGPRSGYTVTKTSSGTTVVDNLGADGTTQLTDAVSLQFSDVTVSLAMADKSKIISEADLKALTELYIAFFNRVPESSGLAFWIDEFKKNSNLNLIAQSFYEVAIQYSTLTGYTASMSNADFVKIVYKNVLGRSGATAPPDADVSYWAGQLGSGAVSKGALVATMLSAARNYKGDATWGFVPTLLENKIAVGLNFAVTQAINYNDTNTSYTKASAVAAAVTPTSTTAATALIPTNTTLLAPPGSFAVTNVNTQTIGSNTFSSSSKLKASWTAPAYTVDHYRISVAETNGASAVSLTALSSELSKTLTDLKAASTYKVIVTACKDPLCNGAGPVSAVGITSTEYWQLQGSGNTLAGLTRFVSDGTVRISATLFGKESAPATANRVQLYYGTTLNTGSVRQPGLTTGLSLSAINAADPTSYLSFTSGNSTTGLLTPVTPTTAIETIATGQGVPLSAAMGGKVRIFVEAQGIDRKTRIYSIDSVDGYVGQDFNSGSSTVCSTFADYSTGGGCGSIKLEIGIEGDTQRPNAKLLNVRQNKVAYPTLNDWRWDGAPGTFMVFTTDRVTTCGADTFMNHGYAVWDGSNWNVQYKADGCPKLFFSAQAAFPMHIGGVRYKLYYGDPAITTGKGSSNLPFLGPKKLIYSDGTLTGLKDRVDFEDWESQASARDVVFLWPNGDKMNDTAEGYIDDYHFLTPTSNLDLQVMYLAITDGISGPFSMTAILRNP